MTLYGYWRSSATYRVRLAFALKGLAYQYVSTDIARGGQFEAQFVTANPQSLVPVLELEDGTYIAQSQAILDYLDSAFPQNPLLPAAPPMRAKAIAFGAAIACEIHPLGNIGVQKHVGKTYGVGRDGGPLWGPIGLPKGLKR